MAENAGRPLRVGLLGIDRAGRGFGARAHVPGIKHAPGVELVAVCTRREESAREAAETHDIPRHYVGLDQMLEDPDIDLINIAVRVRSHYPEAWKALQSGKMVYCEWPLGLNACEARTLSKLAENKRLITGVGTQGRFGPGILYLKDLIEEGYIGEPLFFHMTHFLPRFEVRSTHWWSAMGVYEEHSGALGVATGHATDTLRSVLGEVASLSGYSEVLYPEDTYVDTGEPFEWTADDTVAFLARMESGVTGTVHISNVTTQQMGFSLHVFGKEGQLSATAPYYVSYSPVTVRGLKKHSERAESSYEHVELSPKEMEVLPTPNRYYWVPDLEEGSTGYNLGQAMVAMREAWLRGERFPVDFRAGYRMHHLIESIKKSWAERRWIDLI